MMASPALPIAPPVVGWHHRFRANPMSWLGLALVILVVSAAVFAPWIWPIDPLEQNIGDRLTSLSIAHPLGTDTYGRDVLARMLHAARISLVIGIASIALALTVGSAIGIAAGYIGGWFDAVITSALDVI